MSGCPFVHAQNHPNFVDRYTWRHNGVVRVLLNALWRQLMVINALPVRPTSRAMPFVKAGSRKKSSLAIPKFRGILSKARDWRIGADIIEFCRSSDYHLPAFACLTDQKPDIFLISISIRHIILIEVTSPNEENMLKWGQKKRTRYEELSRFTGHGWKNSL